MLFRQRRAAAIRKARDIDPDRPEHDIVGPEDQDSWWDWVEIEECVENRGFPNVGMAMGWAKKNHGLDLFGTPRVHRNEWPEGEDWKSETTLKIEYQGDGEWIDTDTGMSYELTPAAKRPR
jgi:hypothetical protein